MIGYRGDILSRLKEAGYNTSRLRKEKILGEQTIQRIRQGKLVSWLNIDRICSMLCCDVGDIVVYQGDTKLKECPLCGARPEISRGKIKCRCGLEYSGNIKEWNRKERDR